MRMNYCFREVHALHEDTSISVSKIKLHGRRICLTCSIGTGGSFGVQRKACDDGRLKGENSAGSHSGRGCRVKGGGIHSGVPYA